MKMYDAETMIVEVIAGIDIDSEENIGVLQYRNYIQEKKMKKQRLIKYD